MRKKRKEKEQQKQPQKAKGMVNFVYILMIVFVSFTVFFLLFLVLGSFMGKSEVNRYYGMIKDGNGVMNFARLHLIPNKITLSRYKEVLWTTSDFWYYFWNSVWMSIPILIGTVIVSTLGGYAFAKFKFPFKKPLFFCMILLMLVPYQVMLTPLFIVMNEMNLLGFRASIIVPNIFTPFGTYLIYQFMRGIPDETLEAARVDGAGEVRMLFHIVLPQAMTGIASLIILNLIDTWNLVEQPLTFLKEQFQYPLSVSLSLLQEQESGNAFVCGVVFMIPLFLVFFIGKDSLIKGIKESVVRTTK